MTTADEIREAHGENPFSPTPYQLKADATEAYALKHGWSAEEAAAIAAIVLKTGGKYKDAVRKMRAKSTGGASVKSIRNGKEEKGRKDKTENRTDVIKKAETVSARIVKEVGDLVDILHEIDDLEEKIAGKRETFVSTLRNSNQLREDLHHMREYFVHKPTEELFLGKYKKGTEWSYGEFGVGYDYIVKQLREFNNLQSSLQPLLLGEGVELPTDPSPKDEGGTAEREAKAIKSAVNKVLANADNLPTGLREALESKFTESSQPKEKVIDVPEGEGTITATSSAIPVKGTTAFVVDIYGGTRVAIRDVDRSLLTVPILADILDIILDLAEGTVSDQDFGLLLRSHNLNTEDRLNNGETIEVQMSNPTSETVTE
jgi:hypothetical protein